MAKRKKNATIVVLMDSDEDASIHVLNAAEARKVAYARDLCAGIYSSGPDHNPVGYAAKSLIDAMTFIANNNMALVEERYGLSY